jgi:Uma2 family endonuclease
MCSSYEYARVGMTVPPVSQVGVPRGGLAAALRTVLSVRLDGHGMSALSPAISSVSTPCSFDLAHAFAWDGGALSRGCSDSPDDATELRSRSWYHPFMVANWSTLLFEDSSPRGEPLTIEAWAALPEEAPGELVAGYLTEEEVPDAIHELAVSWLIWTLRTWLGERGFVFGSDLKTVTRPETGRKPDVSVFLEGRAIARRGPVRVPADILIEVVSPSPRDERRDRVEKMAEYAAFGVRFYWIVDPALGSIEIFSLDAAGRYVKVVGVTAGVVDPVPGCDGLTIDVDALWRQLSRLSDV